MEMGVHAYWHLVHFPYQAANLSTTLFDNYSMSSHTLATKNNCLYYKNKLCML